LFLSGNFLGTAIFKHIEGKALPLRRVYNKVRIYGNSTIDKLQIKNVEMENEDIRKIILTDTLTWKVDTLLMCGFENSLAGGNISNLTNPVTSWQVNRREVEGNTLKVLGNLDVGVSEFVDYSAQANKKYVYSIFASSSDELSEPLEAEEIETSFYGYYLLDSDNGIAYKFDLNVTSSDKQYNGDVTINKSYSKFPSISQGKSRYLTTKLSCICGNVDINGSLQQSIQYVDSLREFILNGKQKIFKTRRGEIYKIYTTNYSEKVLEDGILEQPIIVSFDITEVSDI